MISFLIPVKNEELHIRECLDSIFEWNGQFEIIVVDDGSSDSTVNVIKAHYATDKRLTLIETGGCGKVKAYNLAFEKSSGEFFVLIGGDDKIVPSVLDERVHDLGYTGPAVSFCKLRSFSVKRKFDGMVLPHSNHGLRSGGCMAFNRAFGDLAFPIPEALVNEDTWLVLCSIYLDVKEFHIPRVGINYRIHDGNSKKRGAPYAVFREDTWLRARAKFYFYEKFAKVLDKDAATRILNEFSLSLLSYNGNSMSILHVSGVGFKLKLKEYVHSKRILVKVKDVFYRMLVGR